MRVLKGKISVNKLSRISIIILFLLIAIFALGHQPRIVRTAKVEISDPEVSQAFYGELKDFSEEFLIKSDKDFKLYVGILVPDIPNVKKDISAEIFQIKEGNLEIIANLDGKIFQWTPFFEKYGKDSYLWGPEFKAFDSIKGKELKGEDVPAGDYLIRVFSDSNTGKYVLVTGFIEKFPLNEIIRTIFIYPGLKAKFFNDSLASMFFSAYVWLYLGLIYLLGFLFGLTYRFILRKISKKRVRKAHKNIGKFDRIFRLTIAIALFLWAIFTSWSPILLFFSGFALFEAVFSWCGFYALIGKSSCPI